MTTAIQNYRIECPTCHGDGWGADLMCEECLGDGFIIIPFRESRRISKLALVGVFVAVCIVAVLLLR